MKRTVPLLITSIVGFVLIGSAFVPIAETWSEKALIWFDILAGIAFVLGGGNLITSQLKKISRRRPGWGYALVTLIAFLVMLTAGLLKIRSLPATNQEFFGETLVGLPVAALPEFSVQTAVSERARSQPLPLSVQRQVSLTPDAIRIRGWLSSRQASDLAQFDPALEWQCAVERLAGLALPPEALRGRLQFDADHRSLRFRGPMNDDDEPLLRGISEAPAFQAAVARLAEVSRESTTISASPAPAGFELPPTLAGIVNIAQGQVTIRGPMSALQRDALTQEGLDARRMMPPTEVVRNDLIAELTSRGTLNEAQREASKRLLTSDPADQLIASLTLASATPAEEKKACAMLAERNAGVTDIDPKTPAQPPVDLSAAQEDAVRRFLAAGLPEWAEFETELTNAGPFSEAQKAALAAFRRSLPTVGARNRSLFGELIKLGPLSAAQREHLLAPFREEMAWRKDVSRLFFAAHHVKYPWSGEFNHQGTVFWWLYEYVFQSITATMFALLAFYVASAAFRAFRAKNVEATLLLGTAFIILLGRTYAGVLITGWIPPESPFAFLRLENLAVLIMKLFNAAGNRAIMIGIALGIASTSLKILLGIDRSHVGGGD